MTLYHCWKWVAATYVIQILFFLYCSGLAVQASTPDPFHKDIKNDDIVRPKNSTKIVAGGGVGGGTKGKEGGTPLSTAMESVLTFISVFVVGCVITLSVYSWKKFKPTSWRLEFVSKKIIPATSSSIVSIVLDFITFQDYFQVESEEPKGPHKRKHEKILYCKNLRHLALDLS